MGRASIQRILAIGSAAFLASFAGAAGAPSVAAAKAPVTRVLFQAPIPSPTFRSSRPKYPAPERHPRYQSKPIMHYARTVQMGTASVTLKFKARLKPRSIVKFELTF